ncbi:MAG: NusG domain II-containing protein [Oscillospiraceae bacterium]|nr:NusG domain II-containing protein [Oscillospiraceae bacterium]
MNMRKLFGRRDLLLFAVLIIIAIIIAIIYYMIAGHAYDGVVCEISVDGKVVQTVDLSEPDCEFTLPQNKNIRFSVKNHAIAFIASDCPDKICIRTGYINQVGQTAACLPNRVIIRIAAANGESGGADIVVR